MKKKTAKKNTTTKNDRQPKDNYSDKKPINSQLRGFLSLTAAAILFLSLVSFAQGHAARNWLGLVGYFVGWALHIFFGITSYLVPLFLAWMGWRLLFTKPVNHPRLKVLYFCLFLFSTAMLLTLLEDHYPTARTSLRQAFYPHMAPRQVPYHLGGSPLFYLYSEFPIFNLKRLFNTTGVAILFTSTFLASCIFLFKKQISHLLHQLLPRHSPKLPSQTEFNEERDITTELPISTKPENSFMRYVKLRMGGSTPPIPQQSSPNHSIPTQQHHSHDLLAIQPETNLTVRPSLSRKDTTSPFTPSFTSLGMSAKEKNTPKPLNIEEKADIAPLKISRHSAPVTLSTINDNSKTQAQNIPVKPLDSPDKEPKRTPPSSPVNAIFPKGSRDTPRDFQRDTQGSNKAPDSFDRYHLPQLSLLSKGKKVDQHTLKKDLKKQAEVLEETLQSFGIEAKVGQINCGPTITSFEVHPSIGVKVQKIRALENDIALNMEAKSIRIIAPIPGKAAVGIEVPNAQPQEVSFKEMLAHYQEQPNKFHIPILLGKAANGDYVMNDLAKMPHCIIAGATGSGKSVCINTIIMSLVMNAKPDQIKLLMVDPKKVELTPYTRLPHMIAPVITEPKGACAALHWLVKEMESRYEILKQIGVRNIDAFNKRNIDKNVEAALDIEIPERMYYIVTIIDELADLMMVANNDIETPIARIAQMARAVGIHLILATQRPSREVITGLIKANFPTRISFKVASRINSQIVLDEVGAESLLGNGDMLFLPPGTSQLIRAQGAFIRDEDINAVIKCACDQAPARYLVESFDNIGLADDGDEEGEEDHTADSLYEQARDIVINSGNASTTFLQRKLKIGYARAASLIDQLESDGLIGPSEGSKPRRILSSADTKRSASEQQEDNAKVDTFKDTLSALKKLNEDSYV